MIKYRDKIKKSFIKYLFNQTTHITINRIFIMFQSFYKPLSFTTEEDEQLVLHVIKPFIVFQLYNFSISGDHLLFCGVIFLEPTI